MKQSPQTPTLICLAMIGSTAMYAALGYILAPSVRRPAPPGTTLATILGIAAFVALLIALLRAARLQPGLPARSFQTEMVLALALAEAAALCGLVWLFLGGAFSGMLPFVLGSVAVQALFILPKVLAYRGG